MNWLGLLTSLAAVFKSMLELITHAQVKKEVKAELNQSNLQEALDETAKAKSARKSATTDPDNLFADDGFKRD